MVQVQFGEIWNFQRNGTLSARWFFEIRQRRRKKFEEIMNVHSLKRVFGGSGVDVFLVNNIA